MQQPDNLARRLQKKHRRAAVRPAQKKSGVLLSPSATAPAGWLLPPSRHHINGNPWHRSSGSSVDAPALQSAPGGGAKKETTTKTRMALRLGEGATASDQTERRKGKKGCQKN